MAGHQQLTHAQAFPMFDIYPYHQKM